MVNSAQLNSINLDLNKYSFGMSFGARSSKIKVYRY
jgi:hypothetical protein